MTENDFFAKTRADTIPLMLPLFFMDDYGDNETSGGGGYVQNCERRSQNRENFIKFYALFRSLTISFLLQKHPSQPRSLLPPIARSACIFKNSIS